MSLNTFKKPTIIFKIHHLDKYRPSIFSQFDTPPNILIYIAAL